MQFLEISWDLGIPGFSKIFSKDFLGFLMKCTKIFRVIYPSTDARQRERHLRNTRSECRRLTEIPDFIKLLYVF